jgi:hypothetical protein
MRAPERSGSPCAASTYGRLAGSSSSGVTAVRISPPPLESSRSYGSYPATWTGFGPSESPAAFVLLDDLGAALREAIDLERALRLALMGLSNSSGDAVCRGVQLFDIMAELTGLRTPSIKLPVGVLRVIAAGMELVSRVTGRRPMIDPSHVDEFGGRYAYFDSSKAVRELGYSFLSAREIVRRTIAWIVERGFVTEQRRRALRLDASVGAAVNVPF